MGKFILKHRLLIIAIALFVMAILLGRNNSPEADNHTEFHSFGIHLQTKERILEDWMDTLDFNIQHRQLSEFVNENKTAIDQLFSKYGIVIYVFNDDKVNYWTNNALVIPSLPGNFSEPFFKAGNAYVEVQKKETESYSIVGTILIKHDFPYENSFLNNGFHKSFDLQKSYTIYKGVASDKGAIFNSKGEYMFSMVNTGTYENSPFNNVIFILYFLAIILFILYFRNLFSGINIPLSLFIIFAAGVLMVRFYIQFYYQPELLKSLELFHPRHFATSALLPSLGDLLLTISCCIFLLYIFYSKVNLKPIRPKYRFKALVFIFWISLIHLYGISALYILSHLIDDSAFNFEAYNILKLSYFSFTGYLIVILCFLGLSLLIGKAYDHLKQAIAFKQMLWGLLISTLIFSTLWMIAGESFDSISYAAFFIIILYWGYIKYKRKTQVTTIILLLALNSAYVTYYIQSRSFDKRIEESKVMAVNLAREQDPVAETTISDIRSLMKNDTTIRKFLMPEYFNYNILYNYLKKQYFDGYLRRYNMQLTLCNPFDSLLVDQGGEDWFHCYSFFEELVATSGIETNIPDLYHIKNNMDYLNYFFSLPLYLADYKEQVTLYFELVNKPNYEVLGYPELLLEKPATTYENQSLNNYAKYAGNRLLSSIGDFPYAFDRSVYGQTRQEYGFFQNEGYDHLVYNYDQNNSIIISFPTVTFYNTLISFTYIFFFFLITVIILLIISDNTIYFADIQTSIKNKITFSMIAILLASMIIVGAGTIFYTSLQFERNQNNLLSEKIQSVLVEIENKISDVELINQVSPDYLNNLLVKFSNIFYTDINLYDLQGNLYATSRREIFDRKLTSTKMNAVAYRELLLNKKSRIVLKEQIGSLNYYSAYVPFINADNRLVAYLNLPYFAQESLLRQELMRVLVAVINIYAFLIILSVIVAVYISNRLTEPLRVVQQRIKNIDLSKKNDKIEYHGKDEIADLVNEYNKMLGALDHSARLLAKSERESAWREMAKQIAHEIKNPLTPMKLSVQLLERSYKKKDEDFDDRFHRVTQTLIDQIESLSSIATAFSQFAKMPSSKLTRVNIIKPIEQCARLFDKCSNITFSIDTSNQSEIIVKADNDRLLQVFNNLIKNAIQAIPKKRTGKVNVNAVVDDKSVIVEITDDGIGIAGEIENKLFQPNFTTKNSGTGIGLAIVKNIIEEFGGSIWYKSEIGKGTSFYISLPLFDSQDEAADLT